jgi:PTS system mannose-specific IID component
MLDQIFVGLIPLVITLLSFYLLKKKIVSINVLIFGMIILGIVLALLGIA